MFEVSIITAVFSVAFVASIVYSSKKQTEILSRFSHLERKNAKLEKIIAVICADIKKLKKIISKQQLVNDTSVHKNKHVVSENTVKELICELEDEGVLNKEEKRSPKEIIIIQEFIHHYDSDGNIDSDDLAVILDEARELIKSTGVAASQLLETKLRIPQDLAETILDRLEEEGIVGPADGSSHRNVFKRE